MARSKIKPSAYEQAAFVIERFLQSILAIIALAVVYRYCWIGLFSLAHWLPPF
jgi:N-acetylneuraminate 9-O-acetyltransferase